MSWGRNSRLSDLVKARQELSDMFYEYQKIFFIFFSFFKVCLNDSRLLSGQSHEFYSLESFHWLQLVGTKVDFFEHPCCKLISFIPFCRHNYSSSFFQL